MLLKQSLYWLSVGLTALLLASCADSPRKLDISIKPVEIAPLKLERPNPVLPADINLRVILYEDSVYFAFEEKSYLALSNWLSDILRFIKQQNAIIETYEAGLTN